uniref:Uncharacterized protein n=1 Tax=Grammatophora oceanica TaxID=210454 RepID=A0A7S1UQ48_9STRA|mmetsp:Transcript_14261/g.20911  ORF Transcript_14261/g.20911 Transcript_14261/m.20911 type:complete len:320 (+) Transcript_14261:13-972(+)|eukprot:CAMPEP_0194031488 /NCGR_PEP_ID=MMETSP0009_2-20130614/4654_1 /TAXON_ID=210454 /ORGANISM="Grammatophora oceanica, Strain CCMP 410" /LENGTH=319 /DNA_ID=CAMNT_0038671663 /DNA_START=11 /DNA_END=970 /DNA_ORIENTATION=-
MSVAAAARGPLSAPLGQWVMVGLGALYVANPEKFFQTLQRTSQFLLQPESATTPATQQQPIVIMQGAGVTASKNPLLSYLIQLTAGVGVCWGSYMVLVNLLPEAAKGMLPVSRSVFNAAVMKLGKGILDVRDSLLQQMMGLSDKQDELRVKQDDTHDQVLQVKGQVLEAHYDITQMQESLDICQESLTEAEKRQAYIARGVRLLTRGVSSILPQDASLAYELDKFNKAGVEFNQQTPRQEKKQHVPLQLTNQQRSPSSSLMEAPSHNPQGETPGALSNTNLSTSSTHSAVKASKPERSKPEALPLEDIRDLLSSIQVST